MIFTGLSASCPHSVNVPDKTQCEDDSVCFNGVCIAVFFIERRIAHENTGSKYSLLELLFPHTLLSVYVWSSGVLTHDATRNTISSN
jgi:hypothetical protein